MLACLPPRHPCGERAAKEGAFRILWPLSLWEKFFIHNLVFFPQRCSRWLCPCSQTRTAITAALCPDASAFQECPHALDAYLFLVFTIMYLFTFKRGFSCSMSWSLCPTLWWKPGQNLQCTFGGGGLLALCGQNVPLPPCYNMHVTNKRFLCFETPTSEHFLFLEESVCLKISLSISVMRKPYNALVRTLW